MLKKVISLVLLQCVLLSVSAMEERVEASGEESPPEMLQQMNQGRKEPGMGATTDVQNNDQGIQTEQETDFFGFVKTYSTPVASVILLVLAFIFVIFYRRKNY